MRVEDFVAPSLEPGERVEATLSFAETGSSYWQNVLRAPVGLVVPKFKVRSCAVVLTDRRVLLVDKGGVPVEPTAVQAAYPRESVRIGAFSRGAFSGMLTLDVPTGRPVTLSFRRHWGTEAQSVVDSLGYSTTRVT
jgi:hypothetical protein